MKLIHQEFPETVEVGGETVDESEHRKKLMVLRNQLNQQIAGAGAAIPSDELIAESRRVIEEGNRLHEQVQGGLIHVCDTCGARAVNASILAKHLASSGHSGSQREKGELIPPPKRSSAVDVSGNDPEMDRLAQPSTGRPAVTAEQYARGREVLDALPPGVYLKCSSCHKWQMGGDIRFSMPGGFLCEKCDR